MTQQTGIAGIAESPSTEHNAPVQHRWDDLDYVRQVIASGGSYNAMDVLKALGRALEDREHWMGMTGKARSHITRTSMKYWRMKAKRRRALLWLVAERKRRRDIRDTCLGALIHIYKEVNDDYKATTHQSMGQYRSALCKMLLGMIEKVKAGECR